MVRNTEKHRRLYRRAMIQAAGAVAGLLLIGFAGGVLVCSAHTTRDVATTEWDMLYTDSPYNFQLVQPLAAAEPCETNENERIESALLAQGYFIDAVPLDYLLQDYLHAACEESGLDYALALAVIEQETGFQNVTGDDGASEGYMQVQERWNRERMERLGVTDLKDPCGNFRIGCDCLSEQIREYGLPDALTAYNSGKPGDSPYSRAVMERYRNWTVVLQNEASAENEDKRGV